MYKGELSISSSEGKEKIGPEEIFLLGEPILKRAPKEKSPTSFLIPKGYEEWVFPFIEDFPEDEEREMLGDEYLSIVKALKSREIPFGFIVAHRELADPVMAYFLHEKLGIKAVGLFKEIPHQLTCFPRDMLLNLDGKFFINPEANMSPVNNSFVSSFVGEGGAVLKSGKKVLITDSSCYKGVRKRQYEKEVQALTNDFQVGLLPWPIGTEVDIAKRTTRYFPNNHLDRAASLIKGVDDKDYLLVDPNYLSVSGYSKQIRDVCRETDIGLVVVGGEQGSIPYGLNLVQFDDKSVFLSSGHPELEVTVSDIVGKDKVLTTDKPIVGFPVLRRGGIRCLTLNAPKALFKPAA